VTARLRLSGRTAVVTGAAGGIGRAIAQSLSTRDCHLALADLNEAGLVETAALVAKPGLRISQHRLDVSDATAVAEFPQLVLAEHPGVDLLINNAGVALGGTFEEVSPADFEWLFSINFWGVVRMTRAFLPLLRVSGDAHLVNLSSLFGLISPPGQVAYSASKFAVRGFSNGLRQELIGSGVGVMVVHPGGVATSIARDARRAGNLSPLELAVQQKRFQALLKFPPERAGEIIVNGIERRLQRVLVGSDAKLASLIERIMPISYWKIIGRQVR